MSFIAVAMIITADDSLVPLVKIEAVEASKGEGGHGGHPEGECQCPLKGSAVVGTEDDRDHVVEANTGNHSK